MCVVDLAFFWTDIVFDMLMVILFEGKIIHLGQGDEILVYNMFTFSEMNIRKSTFIFPRSKDDRFGPFAVFRFLTVQISVF